MQERTAKGVLVAAVTWIIILGALAVAFKFFVYPSIRGKLQDTTGSESQYKHAINLAADSFSGYCVFRSEAFRKQLKTAGIKLTVVNDKADCAARAKALQKGTVQMAVFSLDSLIKTGAALKEFPATIVMVIDETKGADAIVARKGAVGSLEDLNSPDARIVLTPDSPSEFLARIVVAHFSLPNLPEKWWVEADGAADVYRSFKAAKPNEKRAYALWEPYVSKALEQSDAVVLLDSSRLKGYIVDVLVVQREFLKEQEDLVKQVVEAYFRTAYGYGRQDGGMAKLVKDDAAETGTERLDDKLAEKVVRGIQWKNTLENYAHFGLLSDQEAAGMQHLEDMITNIADVLVKTGAVAGDPLQGKASTLYYDKVLRSLRAESFHPGKSLNIIADMGNEGDLARIRIEKALPKLSDAQWDSLAAVGTMNVEPISFARGTARLNVNSQRELDELASHLSSWPSYYLLVAGHARAEGDVDANTALAQKRAEAAAEYLVSRGIDANRIKPKAAPSSSSDAGEQSVSFAVGQVPY